MLSVRDPFTRMLLHISHTAVSVYIGHGLYPTKQEKSFFKISLTLLLPHSVFFRPLRHPLLTTFLIIPLTYLPSSIHPGTFFFLAPLATFFSSRGTSITLLLAILLALVFCRSLLLSVPPLSCLLRCCIGFHSPLSSLQPRFCQRE